MVTAPHAPNMQREPRTHPAACTASASPLAHTPLGTHTQGPPPAPHGTRPAPQLPVAVKLIFLRQACYTPWCCITKAPCVQRASMGTFPRRSVPSPGPGGRGRGVLGAAG
jgi:hypothetical protein